ncbi:hypothetical protein IKG29_03075 [Candidatus Saccharibacteria bacterium]|nr:hypothetical protein [Candidatus Saccharibacteria bacterium]
MVGREKRKQRKVLGLVILLVATLTFSVLFAGALSGWFEDSKVTLSEEYYGDFEKFDDITAEEYEELVGDKKSFILLVDQGGCTTADRLREFVKDWATDNGIRVQRVMFSDMKETSLHDYIIYYPSVAIISDGQVVGYLRADSNEDAEAYNDYDIFQEWIKKWF